MKRLVIIVVVALSGCSHGPPPLNEPGSSAETWNLNPGRWTPVTDNLNDLRHEPIAGVTH
jgi:hypothetical protein